MQLRNNVELDRPMLLELLDNFQQQTLQTFGFQIRLFIHGAAVMILHSGISASSTRRTTRDVDYIKHVFVHEMRSKGIYDAESRLQSCINTTAQKFSIGTDWMDASMALSLLFAPDSQGHKYDPIYDDSMKPMNIDMNTLYLSPGLRLISIPMVWVVALKLVRYQDGDPMDIVAMLRYDTTINKTSWTSQRVEDWIKTRCWLMGYNHHSQRMDDLRDRIHDAVRLLRNSANDFRWEQDHNPVRMQQLSFGALHEHSQDTYVSPRSHTLPRLPFLPFAFNLPSALHHSSSHLLSPLSTPSISPPVSTPGVEPRYALEFPSTW